MLKNNIEIDVKVKCVEEQITQAGEDREQYVYKDDGTARI